MQDCLIFFGGGLYNIPKIYAWHHIRPEMWFRGDENMDFLFYLSRRIRRSVWSVLTIAAVIAALSIFSCVYADSLLQKQAEIGGAYDALSVDVVISNIQGTKTDRLNIPANYAQLFFDDWDGTSSQWQENSLVPYLKDIRMVSRLYDGASPEKEILGITDPSAAPELSEMAGTVITMLGEEDGLWQSSEKKCIVSYGLFQTLTPEENGSYTMEIFLSGTAQGGKTMTETFQVVGYYSGNGSQIYIPWKTSAELLRTLNGNYIIDSIRATVSDNRQIPQLQERLLRYFSEVNPTAGKDSGGHFAATVMDDTLNQTVSTLRQNLHILELLHPVITGVAILISFAVSFFAVLARKRELTALRFLGVGKGSVCGMVLAEIGMGVLAGDCTLLFLGTSIPAMTIAGIGLSAFVGGFLSCLQTMKKIGITSLREAD